MSKLPIICLLGPTASGKTALSLELIKKFPLEIINVDSTLIYRGMNIGTGKPSAEMLKKYPHHLVNILEPTEAYSVGEFYEQSKACVEDILSRQKYPLFVGGTMLYFHALLNGIAKLPSSSASIREQLKKDIQTQGLFSLYEKLNQVDPLFGAQISSADEQRILRGLEVFALTGRPMSSFWSQQEIPSWNTHLLILDPPRGRVHEAIEHRFGDMMAEGFLDEVKKLYERGDLTEELPSIRAVGYRQLWQHFAYNEPVEKCTEKAIIATRQLAKRQQTWLKKFAGERFNPFNDDEENKIVLSLKRFLNHNG